MKPDLEQFAAAHEADRAAGQTVIFPPLKFNSAPMAPDPTQIPPRRYLYGVKVLRGMVTVVSAPGGTGKSAYCIAMGLAMATNNRLLHDSNKLNRPLRVEYIALEDGVEEAQRRMAAAELHYKVRGPLMASSFSAGELSLVVEVNRTLVINETAVQALVDHCADLDVLIVDPLANSHMVDENSSSTMTPVMNQWKHIAETAEVGVVMVHHNNKGMPGDHAASIRGSTAIVNAARAAYTLSEMGDAEAKRYGVPPDERRRYVRVHNVKSNFSAKNKGEWLKLVSVKLGNVTNDYPEGDHVQVVEPTKLTPKVTTEEVLEGLANNWSKIVEIAKKALDAGRPLRVKSGGDDEAKEDYAPKKVYREFFTDEPTEKQRAAVTKMLENAVADGALERRNWASPKSKKTIKIYAPALSEKT